MKRIRTYITSSALVSGKQISLGPFLTGPVIPFIRIEDVKEVIITALSKLDHAALQHSVSVVQDLQKHQENISRQLELIRQAKKMLMYKGLT